MKNLVYNMSLQEKYFNLIKESLKTIELRLSDEKRKTLKEDDVIVFKSQNDENKVLKTKVLKIYRAKSFEELLPQINIKDTGFDTGEGLVKTLGKFYNAEKQRQNGVLGIKIELCRS